MLTAESLKQSIERLSALPPRKCMEALHAIQDPEERRQVVKGLPLKVHGDALAEAMADNLNRNVLADHARRNPTKAA